jgi:formate-dependent nitrite reductase cytochrome c552 subunit
MKKLLLFVLALTVAVMFSGPAKALETQLVGVDEFDVMCASGEVYEGSCVTSNEDPTDMLAGGIVFSRHNLSSYGEHYQAVQEGFVTVNSTRTDSRIMIKPGTAQADVMGTTQICVFCHTPHHSSHLTGPLWNRNAAGSYTAYSKGGPNQTLAGTATDVSGASLACLSCHDGVTQMDALINAPGNGSNTGGTNGDMGWGFLENDNVGNGAMRAATNAKTRTVIGEDLTDDHPISVAYSSDGRASLRPTSTTIVSIDMFNVKSLDPSYTSAFGRSDNYWSVFGYINVGATIDDLLRDGGQVACASCHDPHYKNLTNDDPNIYRVGPADGPDGDGLFLRRVGGNSNSGVCRTCHNK